MWKKTYIIEMSFDAEGRNKFMQTVVTIGNKDTILEFMIDTVKSSYGDATNIKVEKLFLI